MQKKVLSEIALYHGTIDMPKDWDIDREKLAQDILTSNLFGKEFPFSKKWDMLNTYMRDHVNLEYGFQLVNKKTWGDIYKPKESSLPLKINLSSDFAGRRFWFSMDFKQWHNLPCSLLYSISLMVILTQPVTGLPGSEL